MAEVPPPPTAPRRRFELARSLSLTRRAELFATLFLLAAVAMIPWTIFLALTLPPHYRAGHWRLLWTGFDTSLIIVLALAAWAARYQRQILAGVSLVAATLLLCDAWFDMVTAFGHRDEIVTWITGLGGELPLAVFFIWLYRRLVLGAFEALHVTTSDGEPTRRLRDAPLLGPRQRRRGPSGSPSDPVGND